MHEHHREEHPTPVVLWWFGKIENLRASHSFVNILSMLWLWTRQTKGNAWGNGRPNKIVAKYGVKWRRWVWCWVRCHFFKVEYFGIFSTILSCVENQTKNNFAIVFTFEEHKIYLIFILNHYEIKTYYKWYTHAHTNTHPHTQTNVTYGCSMIVNTSIWDKSLSHVPHSKELGFKVGPSLIGYKCLFPTPIRGKNFPKCLETSISNRNWKQHLYPIKRGTNFETELLEIRHTSKLNFFYLGFPNSVLKPAFSNERVWASP